HAWQLTPPPSTRLVFFVSTSRHHRPLHSFPTRRSSDLIYGRSLDKGKEKIKEVGSKLAPAVKAQMAKGGPAARAGTAQGVRSESAFASAPATDDTAATEAATAPAAADGSTGTTTETSQTW